MFSKFILAYARKWYNFQIILTLFVLFIDMLHFRFVFSNVVDEKLFVQSKT